MNDNPGREHAAVFGKVTANITHEIKNSLAIIKEISGLQADLVSAAERGRPLDASRLGALAEKVTQQVARADQTIKGLNRFAHTVDQTKKTVDMGEEVGFIIHLVDRLFRIRSISVSYTPPAGVVEVETDPFRMAAAVFTSLQAAMDLAGKDGRIEVRVTPLDGGALLQLNANPGGALPSELLARLEGGLEGMGVQVSSPGGASTLELTFPAFMPGANP